MRNSCHETGPRGRRDSRVPTTTWPILSGDYPCNEDGTEIAKIKHTSGERSLAEGVVIQSLVFGKTQAERLLPGLLCQGDARMSVSFPALRGGSTPRPQRKPSRSSGRRRIATSRSTTPTPPPAEPKSSPSRQKLAREKNRDRGLGRHRLLRAGSCREDAREGDPPL